MEAAALNLGKDELRRELWRRWLELWPQEQAEAVRPPVFPGHNRAAERLRRLPEYIKARIVVVMGDPVLLQARINTLQDGKTLIAATPGLKQGLVRVQPGDLPLAQRSRMLRGGSLTQVGQPLRLPQSRLGRVDLVVAPALAVDRQGLILGDGRGLTDLLHALLEHLGALTSATPVVVVCAEEQMVEEVPRQAWDLGADLALTPAASLRFAPALRPDGDLSSLPPRLAGLPLVRSVLAR